MRISDVMTRDVATVPPDANLVEAAKVMRAQNIGFLPVVSNGRIHGVVTDRDIVIRSMCQGRDPRATTVRDVMTHVWIWCYEDEVLTEAARILSENHIRRLIVLGHDKKLAGLLSLDDLALKMSSDRLLGTVLRGGDGRGVEPLLSQVPSLEQLELANLFGHYFFVQRGLELIQPLQYSVIGSFVE